MSARTFKVGDVVSPREAPMFFLRVKDYAHGLIVLSWIDKPEGLGGPSDVIGKQKDFVAVKWWGRKP